MNTQDQQRQWTQAARETLHDTSAPSHSVATEPRPFQESPRQTFYRALAERLPAIVWLTDGDLRLVSSLGTGLAGLGLQPGDAVGTDLYGYFRTDDPEFPPIAAHRGALRGEPV